MIFELLGSRILGAYVGASLYVWTNIIALVLGALAAGYYYGGKLADRWADYKTLSGIFLFSGILFIMVFLSKDILLSLVSSSITDIRFSSFYGTLFLFTPLSFLLGMIQPIATKLQLHSIEDSGAIIGRLGSLGTLGSIIWTMGAWFFLIPFFGVNKLLILSALVCIILALVMQRKHMSILKYFFWLICVLFLWNEYISANHDPKLWTVTLDTPYSHIRVKDMQYPDGEVRNLFVDNITHAGRYLNSNRLLYPYTRAYDLFQVFSPQATDVLMLGGAAYSYPQHFAQNYPEKLLDVVEIDTKMTELAQKYFWLKTHANLNIHHEDARVFLNKTEKKYDAILGDAFGSFYSIPFQLTTLETVQRKYDILSKDGIVLLNLIGSLSGKNARFLQAEYHTYSQIFPEVFVIPVETTEENKIQNMMLVAAKNKDSLEQSTQNSELKTLLSRKKYIEIPKNTPILTDDYAPTEYLINSMSIN